MENSVENGIDMEANIDMNVARSAVFDFWRHFENLPKFMKNVKEVKRTDDKSYLWTVTAPLGSEVSWVAAVTEEVPNKRISWGTVGPADVQSVGSVEFETNNAGGTHLHVTLSYKPPAGVVGHAIASLFNKNPGQQMAEDLQRCKEILEDQVTHDGEEAVTLSDVTRSN